MEQPCVFLLDAPASADASWVQVAKTGTFKDPRYGEFKITQRDFSKWLNNFSGLTLAAGRLGLPVDVDHSPEKKGETEAVGWIKQLDQRGDEMWAKVEWNTLGQELIKDKRYAYLSPSYSPNFEDEHGKQHGTALVGVALTNRPFLQMATVNLSQFAFSLASAPPGSAEDEADDDQGIKQEDITNLESVPYTKGEIHPLDDVMLNVSDAARQKHSVVVKKINGKARHMFPIPPGDRVHARAALALIPKAQKAGHITDAEASAIRRKAHETLGVKDTDGGDKGTQLESYSHSQMELNQVLTAMSLSRETLGVAEDAADEVVLEALAKHEPKPKEAPVPEGHVVLSQETVTKLTSDAASGAAAAEELRVSKFESAFTLAQGAGKVVPAQKEDFRSMFDLSPEATLKLLDGLQPAVNMTPDGHGDLPADLGDAGKQLASDYTDTVTPMAVDGDGLRKLAAANEIMAAKNVSLERALEMVEAGATV